MNSRNGIKVNNERCQNKWLLPGDVLSVAKHRYEILYTPTTDGPPPEVDEDPFSRSLLEKAGLERKPERPQVPRERRKPDDDDLALTWLNE